MRPTLLSIPDVPLLGDLDFHAYAVFLALAFLFGVLLPVRQNYQLPNPHPITPLGGIWVFFGAMIGAKLYWILQYGNPADFLSAAIFWKGGLVFYGGLIGGVLGGIAYLKAVGAPILPVGDLAMPFVALAHAIARIGCFLNGCCWGSRTDLPWAVHYPKNSGYLAYGQHTRDGWIPPDALWSAGVHPTQIYETLGLIAIFLYLRRKYRKPHFTGEVLLFYPMCYGVLRFFTESLRGDSVRHLLDFTASQTIAAAMFFISLGIFAILRLSVWRGERPLSPVNAPAGPPDQALTYEEERLPEKG